MQLEEERAYLVHTSIILGRQVWKSSRTGTWKQELKQTVEECCWLVCSLYLTQLALLFRTEPHIQGWPDPQRAVTSHQSLIKKRRPQTCQHPVRWKHALNWRCLFSDDASFLSWHDITQHSSPSALTSPLQSIEHTVYLTVVSVASDADSSLPAMTTTSSVSSLPWQNTRQRPLQVKNVLWLVAWYSPWSHQGRHGRVHSSRSSQLEFLTSPWTRKQGGQAGMKLRIFLGLSPQWTPFSILDPPPKVSTTSQISTAIGWKPSLHISLWGILTLKSWIYPLGLGKEAENNI